MPPNLAGVDAAARAAIQTRFTTLLHHVDVEALERAFRTLSLDIGQRRPLGVRSGSLALLAFMPLDEIEAIIARNCAWLEDFPAFHPDALRKLVRQTQGQGFSFVDG